MTATPTIALTTAIADVRGVGPRFAPALLRMGIRCVADLILHLPGRYEEQLAEQTIRELYVQFNRRGGAEPGATLPLMTAAGEVTTVRVVPGRRGRVEAIVDDGTGALRVVWFNMGWVAEKVHPGVQLRVMGKAKQYGEHLQLTNPTFEVLNAATVEPANGDDTDGNDHEPHLGGLRPVYPASEEITSRQIARIIDGVLDDALSLLDDHLPADYRRQRALPALADAYRMVHRPPTLDDAKSGRRRLVFDDLFMFQLGVMLRRHQRRTSLVAPALKHNATIEKHLLDRFPFKLTKWQKAVIADLRDDLTHTMPMNRLVQGDVGSGKTVIALYAMLLAVASKHQAAMMAPTELLAEQHFASITRLLEGGRVRIELLTGSLSAPARQARLDDLAAGEIDILIGTHALLTESVRFKSLGVAVIDEQHRFGVHQRAALRTKMTAREADAADEADATGATETAQQRPGSPHMLVMTATPIPRTLAQTLLGDLDVSTIRGLPPGRQLIITRHVSQASADEVYRYVNTRIDAGEQVYVVVPVVDESESGLKDVGSHAEALAAGPMVGRRIATLHGRIKRDERERIMQAFHAGEIDVLVATTVIEVGVDVPNATVMIIEHADRFGLAQLHQLRGRVGRGDKPSLCVLITDPTTEDAQARIEVMTKTTDGFVIAEKDLEIRGPGELFGLKQSGDAPFRVARLPDDAHLLTLARRDARQWIEANPALGGEELALLRRRLFKAYGKTFGLGDVA